MHFPAPKKEPTVEELAERLRIRRERAAAAPRLPGWYRKEKPTALYCTADEGCQEFAHTRNLCRKHYQRLWRRERRERRKS